MYKKYIFRNVWHVFFVCYLDSHLSSCVSCPVTGGRTLRVLQWAFYFFLYRWDGVSSFLARENHWPSLFLFFHLLFFDSDTSIVRGVLCFAAHAVRRAPVFAAVYLSSVYIHSKLYMLVFFFSNKRPWTLSCVIVLFLMLLLWKFYIKTASLYVVYWRDKCVNNKWLLAPSSMCSVIGWCSAYEGLILSSITGQWGGESELLTGEGGCLPWIYIHINDASLLSQDLACC